MKIKVIDADRHPLWGHRTIIADVEELGRVFASRTGIVPVWTCSQRRLVPEDRLEAFDDMMDNAWNEARRNGVSR